MRRLFNPAPALSAFMCITLLLFITTTALAQYVPSKPQYFTSVQHQDQWVGRIREMIRQAELALRKSEAELKNWESQRNNRTFASQIVLMIEGARNDIARHKKHIAELKALLEDIPPVRDLEAERREQQRLADERATSQRRIQEQQQERARQSEASTAKQSQRQERAKGIADALMEGFNNTQKRNRAWEEMQEARRERERQWEREEREIDRLRQQEAEQAARAAARSVQPPPVKQQAYTPTPVTPVKAPVPIPAPEPERYTPPSLGEFLSDDARKFGAEVVVETLTILAEQISDGASNLRDAASGGIGSLPERTYDAIADDLLDSGNDAVKDSAMNLLPEDRRLFVRAMDVPVSILTRNWDTIKDAWNSLVDNHLKNPLDAFTIESIVNEGTGTWPAASR